MEGKWDDIYRFLSEGSYPPSFTRGQRQTLRKFASKFSIHGGNLFYGALPNRRAIKSKEEALSLFKEFHISPMGGHTGIVKTRTSMCSRFFWLGMTSDIQQWVSECEQCQKVGPSPMVVQTLDCIKVSGVWELIGIDLTGPLPLTPSGFKYILTATDYFSKWVEAFPLREKSPEEVCKNLSTIFYRHGCPKRILSDQGPEFVNQINDRLCGLLFTERVVTAAYHPQTNRFDEKTIGNIKRALRKLTNDRQDDWDQYLDATLFSLRSKVHTTTKFSPFLLMYGREARYPSEVPVEMPLSSVALPTDYSQFVKERQELEVDRNEKVQQNIDNAQKKMREASAKRASKKHKPLELKQGDEALLYDAQKRKMEHDYSGNESAPL